MASQDRIDLEHMRLEVADVCDYLLGRTSIDGINYFSINESDPFAMRIQEGLDEQQLSPSTVRAVFNFHDKYKSCSKLNSTEYYYDRAGVYDMLGLEYIAQVSGLEENQKNMVMLFASYGIIPHEYYQWVGSVYLNDEENISVNEDNVFTWFNKLLSNTRICNSYKRLVDSKPGNKWYASFCLELGVDHNSSQAKDLWENYLHSYLLGVYYMYF